MFFAVAQLALTGAAAPWLLPRWRHAGWFALALAGVAAWIAWQFGQLPLGGAWTESWPWFPQLGAAIDFRFDAFGGLMALLATGVGTLVVIYTSPI